MARPARLLPAGGANGMAKSVGITLKDNSGKSEVGVRLDGRLQFDLLEGVMRLYVEVRREKVTLRTRNA